MATKYSTQYNNAYNNGVKVGEGDIDGRVKNLYADFVLTEVFAIGDIAKIGKLPKGATVIEAIIVSPADATGEYDLGWAANGVDAADPNGFIDAAMDTTAQIKKATDAANNAGLFKTFGAETEVELVGTVATTGTSGTIKVQISYVLV